MPFDRRVWLECQSLVAAGYDVTVVCPRGKDSKPYEVIDSVAVHTYRPYAPGGSALGFVAEYVYSFLATARLALKARRKGPFAVVQACNPPDIFWPLARWLRLRDGSRFVFDHHDLCPELYESRFPDGASLPHRGLLFLERMTFRTADRVTSTNESYAAVAVRRGRKRPEHVTVVRTGPDPDKLTPVPEDPALRRGRAHLAAYLGVMGPQDGVDLVLAAADEIVHGMGRDDIAFTLMGAGDCYEDLVAERDRRGLQGHVELTGRVPDETVANVLSTAAVGSVPGPEEPAQRRLDDEQDHGVHGLPPAGGGLRPPRDPGLGRRRGGVRRAERGRRLRPQDRRARRRRGAPDRDGSPGPRARGARAGLDAPAARVRRGVRRPHRPHLVAPAGPAADHDLALSEG